MASKDSAISGLWEMFTLFVLVGIAEKGENNTISRTDIQRAQPDIAKLLKTGGYKVGKTPENTVDRVIQDLERKGFLEMLFRHGGERGLYKVNIAKAKQALPTELGGTNQN